MLKFLQFRPDKKEPWRPFTKQQIEGGKVGQQPAFETVLYVDQDPEGLAEQEVNAVEVVKYLGPMYMDFDCDEKKGQDLNTVLDDVRDVLQYLIEYLGIPEQLIDCWLSGGKGVHITVDERLFGISRAQKYLPLIYREVMLAIKDGAGLSSDSTLDETVYSCGRGRMWRCEGVPRPGKGTYKVATSPAELLDMDAEAYAIHVAGPRPPLQRQAPGDLVVAKCAELIKRAKTTATKKVRAMLEADVIPKDVFKNIDGIPGCIEKLITDGDCPESNHNQACMQLASYIAAKYERSEEAEYMELLVRPFVENVTSSQRPSASERMQHMKTQLARTFKGNFKFSAGALIAAIGEPCRNCPLCRRDIAKGDADSVEDFDQHRHQDSGIIWDTRGYWMLGDNGRRRLTTFTFWAHTEVIDERGNRLELIGHIIDDVGGRFEETVMESAWSSRREFLAAFKGWGEAQTLCSDADLQWLLKAVLHFSRNRCEDKEMIRKTRSKVCGLVIDRSKKGQLVPHYIESAGAITTTGRSYYSYDGEPNMSPRILESPAPLKDDHELSRCIKALTRVNTAVATALTMGWFAACHFREHIQLEEPQFPSLNLNGNAGSGKTSLAILFAYMNGMDYTKTPYINAEIGTVWPLILYLSSSSTAPRLIDEVNPLQIGPTNYPKVMGIIKAGWNKSAAARGNISAGGRGVNQERISAPIVFTSEQVVQSPAVRDRTVEVSLQSKTRKMMHHTEAYKEAHGLRHSLFRLGKGLLTLAMNTSPTEVMEIFKLKGMGIRVDFTDRQKWGFQTCLLGLHMTAEVMREYGVKGVEEVVALESALASWLDSDTSYTEQRGRSASEVAKVLEVLNVMADKDGTGDLVLKPGKHYWRSGNQLTLLLQSCHPVYLRYMRNIGEPAAIKAYQQLTKLIEGETYHERTEMHPDADRQVQVYVLNIPTLSRLGIELNNFQECEVPEEA